MSALDDVIELYNPLDEDGDKRQEGARAELKQLRTDNEQKDKAFQLAVAETVIACNERDMHKRNWENTMEHRDRLGAEIEAHLAALSSIGITPNTEDEEGGWFYETDGGEERADTIEEALQETLKLEGPEVPLIRGELERALNILKPLAYKKNIEDVNYFDLVAVTHFVDEHTEPMR